MNKHALHYHTRLHDWYRQHSILQEKQHRHHDPDTALPPLAEGTGQLTADKLYFINDWCLEVNKTFFTAEKKKRSSKSFQEHRRHNHSSFSKDFSKSKDLKPVRSTDTSTMTDKRKHFKSLTKHAGLSTTRPMKTYRSYDALAGKRRYKQHAKKTGFSTCKVGQLDLCIRNSIKKLSENEGVAKVSHNFLTARSSQMKQKQNGNRSYARCENPPMHSSLIEHDNLYGYYGFISAIVRNVAQCNDNRRSGVTRFSCDTSSPQEISNIEDNDSDETHHTTLASRHESFKATRKQKANVQKDKKTQSVCELIQKGAAPSFSSAQDDVCPDNNEITPTSVSRENGTHPGNIEHVRNIDHSHRGSSVLENKQDNALNQISNKENNSNNPTVLVEKESIHAMTGVMKSKINYSKASKSSKQTHSQQSMYTGADSYFNSNHDKKAVCIENNTNVCINTNTTFQNIVKENSSETNLKESNKKHSNVVITNGTKLLEIDNKDGKKEDLCYLMTETVAPTPCYVVSLCDADRGESYPRMETPTSDNCDKDRGESCTGMDTPTIGNFCLSNSLLNMLTIDDCKISQRYSLLKTSESGQRKVKANSRVPHELKTATNKATIGISKDTRTNNPPLFHTIKGNVVVDRNNRKMPFEKSGLLFRRMELSTSTNLEKGFRTLIREKTTIPGIGQEKSMYRKKAAVVMNNNEGPVYRRLHAALRKQMEELRPSHCVQLQK